MNRPSPFIALLPLGLLAAAAIHLASPGRVDSSAPAAAPAWKAGAASVVITPEHSMWMAGYGGRSAPSEGKLTELWAKALALEDAEGRRGVIISLDLVGIDREMAEKVSALLGEEFGLEREQIALCTSHTHSGPVVGRNLGPLHYYVIGEEQQRLVDAYAEALPGKIAEAVGGALAAMEPSRVQWGSGLATFAVNRRVNVPQDEVPERRATGELAGPRDHDVPVLSVRDGEGALKAVLFGYACHATVLGIQDWNGDYPGYAQMALEEAHPGAVALFWAGCGGDQNPLPRRTVELAEAYGQRLAAAVTDTLDSPMNELPPSLALAWKEIEAPLGTLPTKEEIEAAKQSGNRFEAARAELLSGELEEKGALPTWYPYPVAVWTLGGEVDFVFLGGEVVVDYALRLKRERRGPRTWVAAYANDVMAYIPSLRVLKEGGYEGGGSNVYYGLPALWSEEIEETIIQAVHDLAPAEDR